RAGNGRPADISSDILNFPSPHLLDSGLNMTAQVNFPDIQGIQEGPSLQMDRSGALLYAVNGAGVDIIDARTGQLRERVLLTEPILGGPTEVVPTTPSKVIAITPTGD